MIFLLFLSILCIFWVVKVVYIVLNVQVVLDFPGCLKGLQLFEECLVCILLFLLSFRWCFGCVQLVLGCLKLCKLNTLLRLLGFSSRVVLRCFGLFKLHTSLRLLLFQVLVGLKCWSSFKFVEVDSRCFSLFWLFKLFLEVFDCSMFFSLC